MLCFLLLNLSHGFTAAGSAKIRSLEAFNWFQRACDRMNLRLPGNAPFHLKVRFHAYPGIELLPPGRAQILNGDGDYEETWISPHLWRREVKLGEYHAIEVDSGRARKMMATSDYVPSRVVMLMAALYFPILEELQNREPVLRRTWKMQKFSDGVTERVRIFTPEAHTNQMEFQDSYTFLPSGVLVRSNEWDVTTTFEDETPFGDRFVPRQIRIQADAERDLLTAEIAIDPPTRTNADFFDLPASPAEPGMSLRPRTGWGIQNARSKHLVQDPGTVGLPELLLRINITRQGMTRDVEIIRIKGAWFGADQILAAARNREFEPARVDGSPCQIWWPIPYPPDHWYGWDEVP